MSTRYIKNAGHTDSSAHRSSQIVRELKKTRNALARLQEATEKVKTPVNQLNSPYLPDRPDYNPEAIKGTEKETQWQKVAQDSGYDRDLNLGEILSFDSDTASDKKVLAEINKKKLNIIY